MILGDVRRHVVENLTDMLVGDLVKDLLGLALALDETGTAQQAQMMADQG